MLRNCSPRKVKVFQCFSSVSHFFSQKWLPSSAPAMSHKTGAGNAEPLILLAANVVDEEPWDVIGAIWQPKKNGALRQPESSRPNFVHFRIENPKSWILQRCTKLKCAKVMYLEVYNSLSRLWRRYLPLTWRSACWCIHRHRPQHLHSSCWFGIDLPPQNQPSCKSWFGITGWWLMPHHFGNYCYLGNYTNWNLKLIYIYNMRKNKCCIYLQ